MTARVHHTAIVVRDVETSLHFWRDGIGFSVIMDMHFDGDWPELFGAPSSRLRSLFLGDPEQADAGIVELVQFDESTTEAPAASRRTPPGFFLVSCYVAVEATLARLAALGLGGEPRRIRVPGPVGDVQMATILDPDGVLVELIELPG